jgi:hypothetical protein
MPSPSFPPDNPCTWGPGPIHGCPHGADVPRNQWGQGNLRIDPHNPKGKLYALPRVSTLAGQLDNKGGLIKWAQANAVRGLAVSRALRDRAIVAVNAGDDEGLKAVVAEAETRGGSSDAADRGTALHSVVMPALILGTDPDIDDPAMLASVIAARKALDEAELEPVLMEQFSINITAGYCGTYDLLVKHRPTGKHYVTDVKTSAKLNDRNYPHKVAIQLACYSRATRWCPCRGLLRSPEIDRQRGFLLSLPIDQGQAYLDPVDLDLGWEGLLLAQSARSFGKTKPLLGNGIHIETDAKAPAL